MHETGTPPQTRTLVVLRHAKAEPAGPTDHERGLAANGRVDAAEAGRWLAGRIPEPDHVLVSDAVRTLQTWQEVALAAGWDVEPDASAAMYAAGPESALDLIRAVPADTRTLLVLGHNPTVAYLAELLDDGMGDEGAMADLVSAGFPTCSVAVYSVADAWADLAESGATVQAFHVGRG